MGNLLKVFVLILVIKSACSFSVAKEENDVFGNSLLKQINKILSSENTLISDVVEHMASNEEMTSLFKTSMKIDEQWLTFLRLFKKHFNLILKERLPMHPVINVFLIVNELTIQNILEIRAIFLQLLKNGNNYFSSLNDKTIQKRSIQFSNSPRLPKPIPDLIAGSNVAERLGLLFDKDRKERQGNAIKIQVPSYPFPIENKKLETDLNSEIEIDSIVYEPKYVPDEFPDKSLKHKLFAYKLENKASMADRVHDFLEKVENQKLEAYDLIEALREGLDVDEDEEIEDDA